MATVVDELVTKYTLDASGYHKGAGQVSNVTKSLSSSIAGGLSGISPMAGLNASMTGMSAIFGLFAAEVGVAGVALNKFLEFDTAASIFAGAFGSLEKGKAVMSDLQDYAQGSAFKLDALTEATTRLVAGGLDIDRFLPLMEKFSLAANGLKPEGLLEVASAFLKMKGGSMGEAMETIRKAGISADDLRKQGVKIDKGGQVQSSSEEVFTALEKIAGPGSKIAGIVAALTDSKATKFSNAMDAMDKSMVMFGDTIATFATPYVLTFSNKLNDMTKDGTITTLAESFTTLLQSIMGGGSGQEGFAKGLDNAAFSIAVFNGALGEAIDSFKKLGFGFSDEELKFAKLGFDIMKIINKPDEVLKTDKGTPPATDPVPVIAKNTSKMVELQKQTLDLHKMVFGNGAAAAGVGAEDLSDFRGRRSSVPRYHVNSTLQKIGVLLADLAHESQYAR